MNILLQSKMGKKNVADNLVAMRLNCGYMITGRQQVSKMWRRLHKKTCEECSKTDRIDSIGIFGVTCKARGISGMDGGTQTLERENLVMTGGLTYNHERAIAVRELRRLE
tara:strand:- start:53 stop:382 length:330 start_codon:yes stop_codon:yes gene_type:complete